MSNLPFKSIQSFILGGLVDRLGKTFNTPNPKVIPSSNYLVKLADRLKNSKDLKYPLAYIALVEIRNNEQSYRAQSLAKFGKLMANSDDNTKTYNLSVVPVSYVFNYVYVTDDYSDVLEFAGAWMLSEYGTGSPLSFKLDYYGLEMPIKCSPERNTGMTVPLMDYDNEEPNNFKIEGRLVVDGYINSIQDKYVQVTNLIHKRQAPQQTLTVDGEPVGAETVSPINVSISTNGS